MRIACLVADMNEQGYLESMPPFTAGAVELSRDEMRSIVGRVQSCSQICELGTPETSKAFTTSDQQLDAVPRDSLSVQYCPLHSNRLSVCFSSVFSITMPCSSLSSLTERSSHASGKVNGHFFLRCLERLNIRQITFRFRQ